MTCNGIVWNCCPPQWVHGIQADIVKQIWKELPKHMDTPVAPLDEEMLVDLAKEPAVIEGAWKADGMADIFCQKPATSWCSCCILAFLVPNTNDMDLLGVCFSFSWLGSDRKDGQYIVLIPHGLMCCHKYVFVSDQRGFCVSMC